MALNGLSDEELEKGKTYLIGSYPLRFDTSAKIASQLVHIQLEGRAPDWLVERNRQIAAVTPAERQARRRTARSATARCIRRWWGGRRGFEPRRYAFPRAGQWRALGGGGGVRSGRGRVFVSK